MFALIKFLIPIVVGYFIFKKVTALFAIGSNQQSNQQSNQSGPGHLDGANDVIEICPDCGTELGRRHKCKSTH